MDSSLLSAIPLAISMLCARAALTKWRDMRAFRQGVEAYALLPSSLTAPIALFVAIAETCVSVAHLWGRTALVGACVGAALFTIFLVVTSMKLWEGDVVACHCGLGGADEAISGRTIRRLVLLLAAELIIVTGALDLPFMGDVLISDGIGNGLLSIATALLLIEVGAWFVSGDGAWRVSVKLFYDTRDRMWAR
jgi:hypothetical protein